MGGVITIILRGDPLLQYTTQLLLLTGAIFIIIAILVFRLSHLNDPINQYIKQGIAYQSITSFYSASEKGEE